MRYRSAVVLLDDLDARQAGKLTDEILRLDGVKGVSIDEEDVDKILANDRKVVAELTQCIGQHVPRKNWPEFVGRYYAALLDNALGFKGGDDDKEEEEIVVHMRPGIDWDKQPLGKIPDVELAKKLGVSNVAVGKARRRRKIPAFNHRGGCCRPQGQRAGVKWDEQPLGKIPDIDLAARLGVDPSSVRSARVSRGIPAIDSPDRSRRIGRLAKKNNIPVKDEEEGLRIRRKGKVELVDNEPIPKGHHVHRCPTCRKDAPCEDESCEPVLDTEDGVPMLYTTCQACVDDLAKQRNDGMVTIGSSSSSGRFGPMSRF